jgi:type II secretory pathway component GspD/PulD (secretin)
MIYKLRYSWLLCVVACAVLSFCAQPVPAQTDVAPAAPADVVESAEAVVEAEIAAETETQAEAEGQVEEGLRFNFRGVPLDTVLDYLSKEAGFIIIRNTEVSGRVDVWSHQPLSKDEAIDLLNTILNDKGYAAIRNGRTLTIVDRDEAKQRVIPVRKGNDPEQMPKTDEMVTQIIPVRYTDAVQLVDDLQPLLPSYATLTANQSSNAVVLTDTQANIRRMTEIIQALDTSISEVSTLKVFALKHADAKELADLINKLFESQSSGGGGGGSTDRTSQIREFFSRMRGGGGMPPFLDFMRGRSSGR